MVFQAEETYSLRHIIKSYVEMDKNKDKAEVSIRHGVRKKFEKKFDEIVVVKYLKTI